MFPPVNSNGSRESTRAWMDVQLMTNASGSTRYRHAYYGLA